MPRSLGRLVQTGPLVSFSFWRVDGAGRVPVVSAIKCLQNWFFCRVQSSEAGAAGKRPNGMQPTDIKLEGEAGTDLALVREARQGNMAAFELLIRRHTDKLFRIAFRVTKCHEDAEEVVQDAFIKALNKLHSFEERSRFSTWLTRIAINTALMKIRGKDTFKTVSLSDDENSTDIIPDEVVDWRPNPEQLYSRVELREILVKALDSLPHHYRTIIVLRDVEGFSVAESAEILGLSVTAVKARLLRARLQLREKLNRYFRDDTKAALPPGVQNAWIEKIACGAQSRTSL